MSSVRRNLQGRMHNTAARISYVYTYTYVQCYTSFNGLITNDAKIRAYVNFALFMFSVSRAIPCMTLTAGEEHRLCQNRQLPRKQFCFPEKINLQHEYATKIFLTNMVRE